MKAKNFRFILFLSFCVLYFIFIGTVFSPKLITFGGVVSPFALKSHLSNKTFTLMNVDPQYMGEIQGTNLFVPFDSMQANKAKLPTDLGTQIVLYDKIGQGALQAQKTLQVMGYKKVSVLQGGTDAWTRFGYSYLDLSKLPDEITPVGGLTLPVSWGNFGPQLIKLGVIDKQKFIAATRATPEQIEILTKGSKENIKIDAQNQQFVVDLLWALGLAQKSTVYTDGPLGQQYKNQAGNFASTGGWTLVARGKATDYLNKFDLIPLTSVEHQRVADIAKNVYRPCCGNSAWFPDCNHGMAALAAIELLVSKGYSDDQIYKEVLKLNSFWFPQNYLTVATYFARQGVDWKNVNAKTALGFDYSSYKGFSDVFKKVGPLPYGIKIGGSCGA
ncbi:hypothetical protein HY045_01025 [Candidatus Woesebacteria bacterium]|nr:hypothetical protein [Candidatus Woesebacteria bacterium]